jgi:hypothetical protein
MGYIYTFFPSVKHGRKKEIPKNEGVGKNTQHLHFSGILRIECEWLPLEHD